MTHGRLIQDYIGISSNGGITVLQYADVTILLLQYDMEGQKNI